MEQRPSDMLLFTMAKDKRPYKAPGSLILSGGLRNKKEAKCYHALITLAQMNRWQGHSSTNKNMYRITLNELHRLTGKTCKDWDEYRTTLESIRDNVRLDWACMAPSSHDVIRIGTTPILSEVYLEKDLLGQKMEIVFAIPEGVINDIIKNRWFGQVQTEVLFALKSSYAFNVYLNACLILIEKDRSKNTFYSNGYSIDQWRELLGVDEHLYPQPSRFRNKVFERSCEMVNKMTLKTKRPLNVKFVETGRKTGIYQMVVERVIQDELDAQKRIEDSAEDRLEMDRIKGKEVAQKILDHPKCDDILLSLSLNRDDLKDITEPAFRLYFGMTTHQLPNGVKQEDFLE